MAYRNFQLDDNQLNYWYQYFQNVDEEVFARVCRNYIATETYEPKISVLLKMVKELSKDKFTGMTRQERINFIENRKKNRKKEFGIDE